MEDSIVLPVKGILAVNMSNTKAFIELANCMKELALVVGANSPILETKMGKLIERLETVEVEITIRHRCC